MANNQDILLSCRGVRPGETLSPTLFSLFLSDLEQYFVANNRYLNIDFNTADALFSKHVQLLLLVYADDTSVGIVTGFPKRFGRLT